MPEHGPRRGRILPLLKFPDDLLTVETVKRECAGPQEFDDQGNEFERCPENDHGHLWFHGWCVHCHCEER